VLISRTEARANEQLLRELSAGYVQTLENIRTLEATYTITQYKPGSEAPVAELQRGGTLWIVDKDIRQQERNAQGVIRDQLWNNGLMKVLTLDKNDRDAKYRGNLSSHPVGYVFDYRGFYFADLPSKKRPYPLSEVLTSKDFEGKLAVERRRQTIALQVKIDDYQSEVIFDPQLNYMPVSMKYTNSWKDAKFSYESKLESVRTKFEEVVPGVLYPRSLELKEYREGKLLLTTIVTTEKIRINHAISPDRMSLVFPKGTSVVDEIRDVVYTTGDGERPVKEPVRPSTGTARTSEDAKAPPPEGYSLLSLAVMGFGGLLLVALSLIVWRRFRSGENK
jgi:hypothetical protein